MIGGAFIMNWIQRQLVKVASKVINKYDCHYIDLNSKLMLRDSLFVITEYTFRDSIDEYREVKIEGISLDKHKTKQMYDTVHLSYKNSLMKGK